MLMKLLYSISIVLIIILFSFFVFLLYPIKIGKSVTSHCQLWSHRNNTIERAQQMSHRYKGIEIDVVFDSTLMDFDVRHDEITHASSVRLFDIIDSTKSSECMYWIDLKNLKYYNVSSIIAILESYCTINHGIKDKIVIESSNADQLATVAKAGYFTSYWVPHYENTLVGYLKFFLRTKPVLLRYRFNALSAQHRMLPILELFYPIHHFHLWTDDMNKIIFLPRLHDIARNTSVKVILVDYEIPPTFSRDE